MTTSLKQPVDDESPAQSPGNPVRGESPFEAVSGAGGAGVVASACHAHLAEQADARLTTRPGAS